MKILYYLSGYDGCGYYRVQLAAKYLNRHPEVHAKISTEYNKKEIEEADLIVIQKQTNQKALPFVQYALQAGKKVICEIDDDYFNIPTWNPAYKYYHNKGHELINFYKLSHGMTVTTDFLADELSKYNEKMYVIPNSLDYELLDKIDALDEETKGKYTQYLTVDQKVVPLDGYKEAVKDKIVIGWGGSPTHLRDLDQATQALKEICQENKNVVLVMMACCTDTLMNSLDKSQLFLVKPVPIFRYHQVLASMNWDIGICPIEDNTFNRSKSNLKYLEFGHNKYACVCSKVENYAKTVQHGETGLLAENTAESWKEKKLGRMEAIILELTLI